jgi:hypothetical protein
MRGHLHSGNMLAVKRNVPSQWGSRDEVSVGPLLQLTFSRGVLLLSEMLAYPIDDFVNSVMQGCYNS